VRFLTRFILLAAVGAAARAEPDLPAPRTERAPRVDGRLTEDVWEQAEAHAFGSREHIHEGYREQWSGPADLSGRVRALLSGHALYLAFEVRDDALMHEVGRQWWNGDSIEVFFDTDRTDDGGEGFSEDDFQLFLLPFHEELRWGVVARGPDKPYPTGGLSGLEVERGRVEGGYVVEARIPLWNLEPLRPDGKGRIGFDVALNDVDTPGAETTETYMTFSGRFDLYKTPANFGDLVVGADPGAGPAPAPPEPDSDWLGLVAGLALIVALALATRRVGLRIARDTHRRAAMLGAGFATAAILLAFVPSLARAIDKSRTRDRWSEELQSAAAAATTCLNLDTGPPAARARHALALLRDGRVRIRPHFDYECLPVTEAARRGPADARAPGPHRYGIEIGAGRTRSFPLLGRTAPQHLRLDLRVPEPRQRQPRDAAVAEVRIEFAAGPPVVRRLDRASASAALIETGTRVGDPLRALHVHNLLRYPEIRVDGLYGQDRPPAWTPLPLPTQTPDGVPLDVWRGGPASHVRRVPAGGEVRLPVQRRAHRLWLALDAEGAYPATPYGEDIAVLRLGYRDGGSSSEIRLLNGRDLADAVQLAAHGRVAMQWAQPPGLPEHYTLHPIEVDPARQVETLVVRDRGVLSRLSIVALTAGRRTDGVAGGASRVRLDGDVLSVPDTVRARWRDAGIAVRTPRGATVAFGRRGGVRAAVDLPFGEAGTGELAFRLAPGPFASFVRRHRPTVFGLATLLGAFAGVIAGAAALRRARHLRIKMLVALGAATVVPLVFLVVSLTRTLNERAEADLEEATRTDLRTVLERIDAAQARARDLAYGARDTLELVASGGAPAPDRLAPLLARVRQEIEAEGGFLRTPGLDRPAPATLGNASFVDTVRRSGLYYSPWDGLMALGLARTAQRHACVVRRRWPTPGARSTWCCSGRTDPPRRRRAACRPDWRRARPARSTRRSWRGSRRAAAPPTGPARRSGERASPPRTPCCATASGSSASSGSTGHAPRPRRPRRRSSVPSSCRRSPRCCSS